MEIKIKKLLIYMLILILIATLCSCKTNEQIKPKKQDNEFEIKVAQNVVNLYMKTLMKEDFEGAKKLYSKKLSDKTKDEGKSDLKVKGYTITESSEIGKSGFFKVKVARMNLMKPATTLDECNIKIIKEGTDYKIDDVKNDLEKEAFLENNALRIRSKNNIKNNLLIDKSSLPQYVFPKDDKGNFAKQQVPVHNYSVMNFGYEGEKIAVSTYDKDSYIGIVQIDESTPTQGGNGNGGDGDGGQSQGDQSKGGDKAQGSAPMAREKPIGKEITSLDLIKDSKIEFMTFSDGEKFILVQYNKSNAGRCIRVYNTENGDLIKIKFEDEFAYGKVEIVFSSFDKDALNFDVIQKDMMDKTASDQAGKYQMDLKSFKIKRL